jgi:hypothetical protein
LLEKAEGVDEARFVTLDRGVRRGRARADDDIGAQASPLASGRVPTWACGITYTLGLLNFLFDQTQTPYVRGSDLERGSSARP